ncbi:unnamed protein product [Peronospora belbahrii]|uniref:Uncharacterized protein n=1 Tax=Peronospora belbahrii TaxID=622444 RepID=A0AAU9L2Y4_9STRA|nr:unnamed protein product [Peronospora belbahrii]
MVDSHEDTLRDNMVVSLLCKLRPASSKTDKTIGKKNGVVSELDGVLMCELVMFDSAEDGGEKEGGESRELKKLNAKKNAELKNDKMAKEKQLAELNNFGF